MTPSNGAVTIQWTYTHTKCIHNATVLITDSNGGVRHDLITGDRTSYVVLDVGLNMTYNITITPSTALGAITSMSTSFTVESKGEEIATLNSYSLVPQGLIGWVQGYQPKSELQ